MGKRERSFTVSELLWAQASVLKKLANDWDYATVMEARKFMVANLHNPGNRCPLCGSVFACYKRKIHAQMVLFLQDLVLKGGNVAWVQVNKLRGTRGGDYAKTEEWDLAQRHEEKSGFWEITERGIKFLLERIRVREYVVMVRKDLIIGYLGKKLWARECWKAFDKDEINASLEEALMAFLEANNERV